MDALPGLDLGVDLWKLERAADGLRYEQIGSTPYIHWPERKSPSPP